MRRTKWRGAVAVATALALLAGCGGGGDDASDTTRETEAPDESDAPDDTEAPDTTPPETEPEETDAPTTTAAPETTVRPTLPPVTLPPPVDEPEDTTPEEPVDDGELIVDDFDDDSNMWGPGDSEFTTGEIVDGEMRFEFVENSIDGDGNAWTELYWPSSLDDRAADLHAVRVDTVVSIGRGGVASIVCGVDPTNTDLRYYELSLASSGVVSILEYADDGSAEQLARLPEENVPGAAPDAPPALPTEPAFEYDPQAYYALGAECVLSPEGAELTLELDGDVLLTATDAEDPIEAGTVGISFTQSRLLNAIEGFSPFSVAFDWFSAYDISGGDSAGAVVFDDTFDEVSGEWAPEEMVTEHATAEIADGTYHYEMATSIQETLPEGQVVTPAMDYPLLFDAMETELTEVRVDASVRVGYGGSAGVTCGWTTDNDYYNFLITSLGTVAIRKQHGDFYDVLAPKAGQDPDGPLELPTADDVVFEWDPNRFYDVSAECYLSEEAAILEMSVDGEIVAQYVDITDPISMGVTGIAFLESGLITLVEGFGPWTADIERFTVTDLRDIDDDPSTGDVPLEDGFLSECVDEPGDLIDDKGNPIEPIPDGGVDLTSVSLESDGEALIVTWYLADQPGFPDSGMKRARSWNVNLYAGDGEIITLTGVLAADGRLSGYADSNLAEKERVDLSDGFILFVSQMFLTVPFDEVDLPSEFEWDAFALFSAAEQDVCPNDLGTVTVP